MYIKKSCYWHCQKLFFEKIENYDRQTDRIETPRQRLKIILLLLLLLTNVWHFLFCILLNMMFNPQSFFLNILRDKNGMWHIVCTAVSIKELIRDAESMERRAALEHQNFQKPGKYGTMIGLCFYEKREALQFLYQV